MVAAGEGLYLLRPGAAGFLKSEASTETDDFVAVAVEPRRSGRIALAGRRIGRAWRVRGRKGDEVQRPVCKAKRVPQVQS